MQLALHHAPRDLRSVQPCLLLAIERRRLREAQGRVHRRRLSLATEDSSIVAQMNDQDDEPLDLPVMFTWSKLASLLDMSKYRIGNVLREARLEPRTVGNRFVTYLDQIRTQHPELFNSMIDRLKMRTFQHHFEVLEKQRLEHRELKRKEWEARREERRARHARNALKPPHNPE